MKHAWKIIILFAELLAASSSDGQLIPVPPSAFADLTPSRLTIQCDAVLFRLGQNPQIFNLAPGTPRSPQSIGKLLREEVFPAVQSKADVIQLGRDWYDFGREFIRWPACTVQGLGAETYLTSNTEWGGPLDVCNFELSDGSVAQDLSLISTSRPIRQSTLVGCSSYVSGKREVVIRRCKLAAKNWCIYSWADPGNSFTIEDVYIKSGRQGISMCNSGLGDTCVIHNVAIDIDPTLSIYPGVVSEGTYFNGGAVNEGLLAVVIMGGHTTIDGLKVNIPTTDGFPDYKLNRPMRQAAVTTEYSHGAAGNTNVEIVRMDSRVAKSTRTVGYDIDHQESGKVSYSRSTGSGENGKLITKGAVTEK